MTKHEAGRCLPATLNFQNTELSIIDRDGVPWVTGPDIARALGCARADTISRIYGRNREEFTDEMSRTVKLTLRGQIAPASHRIFSPRGAQLIAMLAKTPKAKDFRRWVLDVLEGLATPHPTPDEPASGGVTADQMAALRSVIVRDVTFDLMSKITPMLADRAAPVSAPVPVLAAPDDMPRLAPGHAVFVIAGRKVIVDTRDGNPRRGERAVVIRVEDGEAPQVVTILGDPPAKVWFDRCKIYDSGVAWHIPVGVVIGRVVWEGA
ncbi:MAG: BRO family protein [Pseudomonadota bacterium]